MEDPPGRYVKQGTGKTGSETVSIRKNQSGFCQTLETCGVPKETLLLSRLLPKNQKEL